MKFNKVAFIASNSKEAQKALKELSKIYSNNDVDKADIIVALGGDGLLPVSYTHLRAHET